MTTATETAREVERLMALARQADCQADLLCEEASQARLASRWLLKRANDLQAPLRDQRAGETGEGRS